MAGIGQSLVLVLLCGLCTFLTTISLSAIATNGAMKVMLIFSVKSSLPCVGSLVHCWHPFYFSLSFVMNNSQDFNFIL